MIPSIFEPETFIIEFSEVDYVRKVVLNLKIDHFSIFASYQFMVNFRPLGGRMSRRDLPDQTKQITGFQNLLKFLKYRSGVMVFGAG